MGASVGKIVASCVALVVVAGCSKREAEPKAASKAAPGDQAVVAANDTPPQVDKPAATAVAAANEKAPEGMLWLAGTVNDAPAGSPAPGVAEVCLHTPKNERPCVKTSQAGAYRIAVPKRSQIALLVRGDKLMPTLRALVTGDQDRNIGNTRAVSKGGLDDVARLLAVELRPDLGVVFFSGRAGTSAALEPASGRAFYMSYGSKLDKSASAVPMRGSAGILNVMPGRTAIRFAHPDGPCRFNSDNSFSAWPDPSDSGIAIVPVLAGHHTHMTTMHCGKK